MSSDELNKAIKEEDEVDEFGFPKGLDVHSDASSKDSKEIPEVIKIKMDLRVWKCGCVALLMNEPTDKDKDVWKNSSVRAIEVISCDKRRGDVAGHPLSLAIVALKESTPEFSAHIDYETEVTITRLQERSESRQISTDKEQDLAAISLLQTLIKRPKGGN